MRVTVVVPAHDEAVSIETVVRGCLASDPRVVEVLVVDDGSTDGTAELAASAGARVLRGTDNRGKGHAVREGCRNALGDVVVLIDADGQDDPAEIPVLLDALTEGVDMAIGSRFLGEFRPGAITRVNRLGTQALTRLHNFLFGGRTTDCLAGFRAVRHSMLDRIDIGANGYDIEVDMLARVLRAGGRVVDVPVSRSAREDGSSGLNNITDGSRILARMLVLRLRG
jgi:glycosyltransferase involved in cell wall biosynthesis